MSDHCWMWSGAYFPSGYGQAWWNGHGRPIQAHRLVYEELVGQIPAGKQIDHLCRVRGCVNPAHMRVVTSRENLMANKSRCLAKANSEKAVCPKGHPYDESNTYTCKQGKRSCKICKIDNKRAARRARRISAHGTRPIHDAGCSLGTGDVVLTGPTP